MTLKIGTAPDSWGVWFAHDPRQPPWQQFLDEAVKAGYDCLEVGPYGYLPPDPATLKAELERRGLTVCAGTVVEHLEDPSRWQALVQLVRASSQLVAMLGGRFLVLIDDTYTDLFTGDQRTGAHLDTDAWKRLIETTNKVATIVQDEFDLRLVFHPHAESHVEYEDQIETFLAETDPGYVFLCLDTGHHAYRGGDPISFMRRHAQRIPYLHLKSVDRTVQRRVERERVPFAAAVEAGVFCEPFRGAVDFPVFRDLLTELNFDGWGIVEQDMFPAPFDKPLPIAQRTRDYLREIGLG